MAIKVTEVLIDDLDGSEIPANTGSTVTFAYQGNQYEIDLSDANTEKFDSVMNMFITNARKVAAGNKTSRKNANGRAPAADLSSVRAWLREQGHTVSERGRIPAPLLEEFDNAH